MNVRLFKGYAQAIFSGAVLIAAAVLVAFQWANVSAFSLFGYSYSIMTSGSRYTGGVNTALLMLASAVGGVVAHQLLRLLVAGLRNLSQGRRRQEQEKAEHRLAELEKAAHPPTQG